MATLKEYYEIDFNHALKASGVIPKRDKVGFEIPGHLIYDFISYSSFLSFYFEQDDLNLEFFKNFLNLYKSEYHAQWVFNGTIVLPNSHLVNGIRIAVQNSNGLNISVAFPGDQPIDTKELKWTGQMYLYSESDLTMAEVEALSVLAKSFGYHIQFRSKEYQEKRSMAQRPLAFISHDSRDKDSVARAIASKLTSMGCPVWYDEYSLKVGDGLRESIEKGIKECKHCVLVLSKNFISNGGWTKAEFESVFIKQIHEKSNIVLPVWVDVESADVYDYCPSLLNIFGLAWKAGEEEVCRKLFTKIVEK